MIEFCRSHPEVVLLILSAFVSAVFKPRTPEEYAALPPRLAAFLKLVGALGIDPVKAVHAIIAIKTGEPDPEGKLPPTNGGAS